jgi:hypothetical protein
VVRRAHQRLTAAGGLIADIDVGEASGLKRRNRDLVKVPPRGAAGRRPFRLSSNGMGLQEPQA